MKIFLLKKGNFCDVKKLLYELKEERRKKVSEKEINASYRKKLCKTKAQTDYEKLIKRIMKTF